MEIKTNLTVDAIGLSCPMPIVKTKKAMNELQPGQVIEVLTTDKGSIADMKAWAKTTGHHYIGMIEEEGVMKHYLRKVSDAEQQEKKHPYVISNDELQEKITNEEKFVLLDVREPAEYAFGHIPDAISVPLEKLEEKLASFNLEDPIYVICRTGNRSDFAAQILAEKGFKHVYNVVPGMSEWKGTIEKSFK